MTAWICESPDHEGDRLIRNPFDRFSKRVLYFRADSGRRLHEKTLPAGHRCKVCADRENAELEIQIKRYQRAPREEYRLF